MRVKEPEALTAASFKPDMKNPAGNDQMGRCRRGSGSNKRVWCAGNQAARRRRATVSMPRAEPNSQTAAGTGTSVPTGTTVLISRISFFSI